MKTARNIFLCMVLGYIAAHLSHESKTMDGIRSSIDLQTVLIIQSNRSQRSAAVRPDDENNPEGI